MAHLNHFTFGWLTPVIAYTASVLGSLLGLLCTVRAQQFRTSGRHVRWLLLAAIAIGGTGIWLMHFSAMIGFGVSGSVVRYDLWLTVGSAILAMLVVGCGLFVVGYGEPSLGKVVVGGTFTGLGVGGMHYMGMSGMRVNGVISYNLALVVASFAIAIVAATVALWFTISLQNWAAITVAALIMGVAVCGMHYTGMAALRVRLGAGQEAVSGVDPLHFMIPVIIVAFVVLGFLLFAVVTGPSEEDLKIRNQLFDYAPAHVQLPHGSGSHRRTYPPAP
jgi:NO-binding membrane sensor protein with MHYT domain